jgi:thioredoxin reductase
MTEHAVLIAGGGPTGLMLAGELALAGVDVAIGERRPNQDLAAQDHRARWRSPQAARAATQSPGRDGRASRFSTRLSMQRTYYARVGALLPQSGLQRRPFARGR